jgi:hypothetical protein
MTKKPPDPGPSAPRSDHEDARRRDEDDPLIRLAHVLFILWVAGSVAWAFFAAKLAHDHGWLEHRPELAAILVLAPPILAHVLANFLVKRTGNPRFHS